MAFTVLSIERSGLKGYMRFSSGQLSPAYRSSAQHQQRSRASAKGYSKMYFRHLNKGAPKTSDSPLLWNYFPQPHICKLTIKATVK